MLNKKNILKVYNNKIIIVYCYNLITIIYTFLKYSLIIFMIALVLGFLVLNFFSYSLEAAGYHVHLRWAFPFFEIDANKSSPNDSLKEAAKLFSRFGPLGDYVGGLLNPLVALCALGGLLISINIQGKTLRATRSGLREQLDQENFFQLLANREIAIQNLELPSKRYFRNEKTFMGRAAIREILRHINESINSIYLSENLVDEILKGYAVDVNGAKINKKRLVPLKKRIAVFIMLYSKLSDSSNVTWSKNAKLAASDQHNMFRSKYLVDNLEDLLGHVFRATYQTLKFIYRSDFKLEKKRDLQNYLRAQMSEGEFAVFALTAITNIGEKSRAVAIAFHLYQNRLLSEDWAEPLAIFFDPMRAANYEFAEKLNYIPLFVQLDIKSSAYLKDRLDIEEDSVDNLVKDINRSRNSILEYMRLL